MDKSVDSKIIKLYKKMHNCYTKGNYRRAKIYQKIIRLLFAAEIPCSVELGNNVDLLHGGLGVVLHERAVVGSNSKIYQNVTIAGMPDGGVPVIGENVTIGTGAVILGGIKIGNYAKIGANAVVLKDVPDHATAVGVPARVVKIGSSAPN